MAPSRLAGRPPQGNRVRAGGGRPVPGREGEDPRATAQVPRLTRERSPLLFEQRWLDRLKPAHARNAGTRYLELDGDVPGRHAQYPPAPAWGLESAALAEIT